MLYLLAYLALILLGIYLGAGIVVALKCDMLARAYGMGRRRRLRQFLRNVFLP